MFSQASRSFLYNSWILATILALASFIWCVLFPEFGTTKTINKYHHEGILLMSVTEVEEFKYDIANNDCDIRQLTVINHSDNILVTFEFYSPNNLEYGNVNPVYIHSGYGTWAWTLLMVSGFILMFLTILPKLD